MREDVKSVEPAHLNLMTASDEDAEHAIGYPVTRIPPMDHNMVYVEGEKLKYALSTLTK